MRIKLLLNSEPVDAILDETTGIILHAEYETGIALDEVDLLRLEIEYLDVINEYLSPQERTRV